jgi:hypothetical protein
MPYPLARLLQWGHQRRFGRKPRTSASPPDSGRIAASHRSATNRLTRDEARRMTVLRQAAAAVASVAADKRGVDRVAAADAAMHYLSRRPKAEVH